MDPKDFVENHVPVMNSSEKVYALFKGLGYETLDPSFRGKEAWGLREKDKEFVEEIYTIANYKKRFQIFLVELKSYSPATIRNLPIYFERETQYPFFVITSDYRNYTFILVEKIREDVGVWKRKLTKLNLDIDSAYYTDKWILSEIAIETELQDPAQIYNKLTQSFSVEKVTKRFFDDYRATFPIIRDSLIKLIPDAKWVHDYSLQLLNRIMFLYFVQKKRWLDNNPRFITDFWQVYKKALSACDAQAGRMEKDSFYEKWLSILFFEAFNNKFFPKPYFSKDLNSALALAPFLNGGLFTPNKLDEQSFKITDGLFEKIFGFFDKYNFTIREELPLEVEVAVDPEMIGKVYESLVNISEEADERGDAGIFYTARTEIDFMCRRSLVEYFHNHLEIEQALIYEFVFAKTDEDKKQVDTKISKHKLWEKIEILLDDLTVVDPACGSGSFLVGMLSILSDIYKRAYSHLNRQMSDFDIKKSIIGRSLYGVDVMDWAVHVAELRLWLQLIVETKLELAQLKIQPLLPNLSFKIRQGDSLVQEIGGVNLAVRTGTSNISPSLKRKLTELKTEKLKFFNNDPSRKFRSESMLLQEELNIFRSILDDRALNLSNRIKSLQRAIHEKPRQLRFLEEDKEEKHPELFDEKEATQKEIEKLQEELENVTEARSALKGAQDKPFVWDIDFAEIFSGERNGFDIVIGNPPYVRQEKIAPPLVPKDKVTNEMKRLYKDKLEDSIRAHFEGRLPKKLDKKSDLYIYFYFHGLALLNPKGTFCFITSNSWLDVGYGKDLQQFLLENAHVKAIYDNCAKRSFTQADINTIIVVFSPPLNRRGDGLENSAKFVLFKKPFEDVINTGNLTEIENVRDTLNTNSYRVISVPQIKLLEKGWEYPEDTTEEYKKIFKFGIGKYTGNKWGGKYLRAPDIFFTILEKGKDKLVRLGDIAEVRFGIKTGCNEFFYLPSKHFDIKKEGKYYRLIPKHEGLLDDLRIEEEYLQPVIKSPRECKSIFVNPNDLKQNIFMCHKSKAEMINFSVVRYVEWGEKQHFNKIPSCKGRQKWWDLGIWKYPDMVWSDAYNDRYATFSIPQDYYADKRFFYIYPKNSKLFEITRLYLNSSIIPLFIENEGIANLAEGVIYTNVYWLKKLPVFYDIDCPFSLKKFRNKKVKSIFTELGISPKQPIRSQKPNPLPDRKDLDDVVFDILGLTQAERNEVYWAVCELVKNRLEKARSV